MTFGELLKTTREAAGMTQTELADKADVPLGSLRGYEQGQRLPGWVQTVRLSEAMGVSTDVFSKCDEVGGVKGGTKTAQPKHLIGKSNEVGTQKADRMRKEAKHVFRKDGDLRTQLERLKRLANADRATYAPVLLSDAATIIEREIKAMFKILGAINSEQE